MTKKVISILLALSMVLAMLSACNKEPVENVGNSNNQQVEEIDPNENPDGGEVEVPETIDLVVNGVSDYVIVRGENAYISEVTASTELQRYIKQMTGFELPIVTDTSEPVEKEIVVGKTNRETEGEFDRDELGTDGFVIKTKDSKLYLVGGEKRGTLYSVYEFLDAYLGCRFYCAEIEKIPEVQTISIEKIEEDKQIPVFEFRHLSGNDSIAKARLSLGATEEFGGIYDWLTWCHTYSQLVPFEKYYDEHPEYFTVDKEKYYSTASAGDNAGQLCLTNPEVLEIAIESTREILNRYKEDTSPKFISITQNDNQDYCTCDNCVAFCEAEGSWCAATLQFANNIATALKEEFPNVIFETFAYQYTRNLPKTVRPAENVLIRLCSIEECFSHPISEHSDNLNSSDAMVKNNFNKDFQDWASTGCKLHIWDYTANFGNGMAPYPNFNVLLENVRYFAENNVIGIYESGIYQKNAEFDKLRRYVLSKIMWDPYMSEEEYWGHIDDFLEGVYGPGWTYIREFLDLIHSEASDDCFGLSAHPNDIFDLGKAVEIHKQKEVPEDLTADMIRDYENVDWTKYWNFFLDIVEYPKILEESKRLFELAFEAAETDAQRRELDMIYTQVEVVESYYLDKKLGYGGSALGKIMVNYFNANPEEFTDQEQVDYRIAIIKLAREQAYGAYAEFNRALAEKFLSYGIVADIVGMDAVISDINSLDFTKVPVKWDE